jgi:hypothetical protein
LHLKHFPKLSAFAQQHMLNLEFADPRCRVVAQREKVPRRTSEQQRKSNVIALSNNNNHHV